MLQINAKEYKSRYDWVVEVIDWELCKSLNSTIRTDVMFWPFDPAKNAIQGDAPEGSDTF